MTDWHSFLKDHGAHLQGDTITGFKQMPAEDENLLVPMTDYRLITVSGPDAFKFLQGQVTCDLRRLEAGEILPGAHCNAKGRMISSFYIAATAENAYTLRVRSDLAQTAFSALKKYIVFSKAEILLSENVALAVIPRQGPVRFAPQPEPGYISNTDEYSLARHTHGLLEFWLTPEQAEALWPALADIARPAPSSALQQWLIQHGLPEVSAATGEEFIPQMFNYDLLDAISFKKGCYTGQEIIARLHYRGQTKKRTYPATLTQGPCPSVGEQLCADSAPDKPIATVVAASPSPHGHQLLVTANSEHFESKQSLHIQGEMSRNIQWGTPPYAIP